MKPKTDWILVLILVMAFLLVTSIGSAESLTPLMPRFQMAGRPLILPNNSFDASRLAIHFAATYAITTLTYYFVTKRLGWDPIPSFFFSALLAGTVGVVWECSETTGPQNDNFNRSMLYNAAGIAGAGLTITILEF